jgi:hypothetical protein
MALGRPAGIISGIARAGFQSFLSLRGGDAKKGIMFGWGTMMRKPRRIRRSIATAAVCLMGTGCLRGEGWESAWQANAGEYTFRLSLGTPTAAPTKNERHQLRTYRFEVLAPPESSLNRNGDTWDVHGVVGVQLEDDAVCRARHLTDARTSPCMVLIFRAEAPKKPSGIVQATRDDYGLPDLHEHKFVGYFYKGYCVAGTSDCLLLRREPERGEVLRTVESMKFGRSQ